MLVQKLKKKLKHALGLYRTRGVGGVANHLKFLRLAHESDKNYQKWIAEVDALDEADRENIRRRVAEMRQKPLISVVMPVYNVEEKWLRLAIESVRKQIYPHWEFCIADDKSPAPHVRRVLKEYAAKDERIKVVFRPENGHISAASNSALELATGEFCALLDHDDELSEHALYFVAEEINRFPATDMIYSDEDMLDQNGRCYEPKFKPDWSPDLLYSLNLITHLSVYRTEILRKIGGFRLGVEGSQDYDLALRFVEQIPETHIRHIPHILYHWRAIPGSVAFGADEKNYAHEAARRALLQHFERTGVSATVEEGFARLHHTVYPIPSPAPTASLIVVGDENFSAKSIENLLSETDYPNVELLLVQNKTSHSSTDTRVKVLESDFNSAAEARNFAAAKASGDVLVFLAADLQALTAGWLREMVSQALRPKIGAVGARLLYADESVRHAGYILGINGTVGTPYHRLPRENHGNMVRSQVVGNFAAVSADCLAVRREVFESVGGFDAENLPDKFYDVDFCLRLRECGFRIVWTPYALLRGCENYKNKAKNFEKEESYLKKCWREIIAEDPYYNPNLTRKSENFALQIPPPDGLRPYRVRNI